MKIADRNTTQGRDDTVPPERAGAGDGFPQKTLDGAEADSGISKDGEVAVPASEVSQSPVRVARSPTFKTAQPPSPPPPAPVQSSTGILGRLLRMAEGYRLSGCPNQAIEMYLELVERNGTTQEGRVAREKLMLICEEYEVQGKARQARALYERLL